MNVDSATTVVGDMYASCCCNHFADFGNDTTVVNVTSNVVVVAVECDAI